MRVHVVPRASRSEVVGWHGGAIRIRLNAPPVDGAANAELLRFVAEQLGVPARTVTLVRGHASRQKEIRVDGLTDLEIARRLGLP